MGTKNQAYTVRGMFAWWGTARVRGGGAAAHKVIPVC